MLQICIKYINIYAIMQRVFFAQEVPDFFKGQPEIQSLGYYVSYCNSIHIILDSQENFCYTHIYRILSLKHYSRITGSSKNEE